MDLSRAATLIIPVGASPADVPAVVTACLPEGFDLVCVTGFAVMDQPSALNPLPMVKLAQSTSSGSILGIPAGQQVVTATFAASTEGTYGGSLTVLIAPKESTEHAS